MIPVFILYSSLLYFLFSLIFIRGNDKYFTIFFIRTILISALFILPDKLAVVEINEVRSTGIRHNFFLYYLLSFPVVEILDMPRAAMASVSNSIVFLISVVIINSLNFEEKSNKRLYLFILSSYPDVLYFSAFSLRDPAIAYISVSLVFFLYMHLSKGLKPNRKIVTACALSLFSLRSELFIWMIALYIIYFLAKHISKQGFLISVLVLISAAISLVELILPSMLRYVGFISNYLQISGTEAWRIIVTARYLRQFSDSDGSGTTSALFSPIEYFDMGNIELLFWQSTSFIFITFSQKELPIYLAVLSGVAVYTVAAYRFTVQKIPKEKIFILLAGFLSFAIYAPFIVNGGNVFRIRLTMLAIFILFIVLSKSSAERR